MNNIWTAEPERQLWRPRKQRPLTREQKKRRRDYIREVRQNAMPGNSHYIIFPDKP